MNPKTRIVHTSDLHLTINSKNKKIIGKKEFTQIINFCLDNTVNALLIVGDLFDDKKPKKEVISFVVHQLKRLDRSEIPVFIVPGNKDPVIKDYLSIKKSFPKNVFLFKNKKITPLIYLNLTVYGRAYINEKIYPLNNFVAKKEKNIVIGLAHGSFIKSNSNNPKKKIDLPITLKQINNSNLNYLALGHFHDFTFIKSKVKCAYSGSPIPSKTYSSSKPSFAFVTFEGKKPKVKRMMST